MVRIYNFTFNAFSLSYLRFIDIVSNTNRFAHCKVRPSSLRMPSFPTPHHWIGGTISNNNINKKWLSTKKCCFSQPYYHDRFIYINLEKFYNYLLLVLMIFSSNTSLTSLTHTNYHIPHNIIYLTIEKYSHANYLCRISTNIYHVILQWYPFLLLSWVIPGWELVCGRVLRYYIITPHDVERSRPVFYFVYLQLFSAKHFHCFFHIL